MSFCRDQIVTFLITRSMRQKRLAAYRARIVPMAEGHVLEIGMGSRPQPSLLFEERGAFDQSGSVAQAWAPQIFMS